VLFSDSTCRTGVEKLYRLDECIPKLLAKTIGRAVADWEMHSVADSWKRANLSGLQPEHVEDWTDT